MAVSLALWPTEVSELEIAWKDGRADVSDIPRALTQYQTDPVGFAVKELGIPEHTIRWSRNPGYAVHEWDGTPDPLVAMAEGLAEGKNIGVQSGTGTSKSFTVGWLYLWWLASWERSKVFSFAPVEKQLRLHSWNEMRRYWPRFRRLFPRAELTDLRIRMIPGSDDWGAWGYAVGVRAEESAGSGTATKAQGMHAERMLLVYEETPGIPPPVLLAGEQTVMGSGNLRLAVGNPDHNQDALAEFCRDPNVTDLRISALDFPNVVCDDEKLIPGAVTRHDVNRRLRKYGADDPLHFMSRVRGICPMQASDALIRQEWLDRAGERWRDLETRAKYAALGLPSMGVDVANSESGDKGAIARGRGACLDEVVAFPCPDAIKLAHRIMVEAALLGCDERNVGIDTAGVGGPTWSRCVEDGHRFESLNGGEKARPLVDEELLREGGPPVREEEVYRNLRAQMWWRFRLDLQHDRVALPPDSELHKDLVVPRWTSKFGKIQVEEKLEIRKRLGRSPDRGDAVVYWNWVRHRRALPVEEPVVSAWDPEILRFEAEESRRVRSKPPKRKKDENPLLIERLR